MGLSVTAWIAISMCDVVGMTRILWQRKRSRPNCRERIRLSWPCSENDAAEPVSAEVVTNLFEKGINNLSDNEQDQLFGADRKSAEYMKLRNKAIRTLSLDEQEKIQKHENTTVFSFNLDAEIWFGCFWKPNGTLKLKWN